MVAYPAAPDKGRYAAQAFAEIPVREVPKQESDDFRSSDVTFHEKGSTKATSVRPPVKLDFGVTGVWFEGGGRRSESFNDGVNGGTATSGEAAFNFCPGKDDGSLQIGFQVHHPHNIKSAKLELFCRGLATPIWSTHWGRGFGAEAPADIGTLIPAEHDDGTVDKKLAWTATVAVDKTITDGARKADGTLFPDGLLTAARSPYLLKMTVSARAAADDSPSTDQFGYPLTAWTYVHVLVHEVALRWGTPAAIPRDRADVPLASPAYHARGKDKTLDELLAREKALLAVLEKKPVTDDQNVALEAGFFQYTEFSNNLAGERAYYQDMWGDGPLVPLFAAATIKALDGRSGVDEPRALGRLPFLWDWQDNTTETPTQRLDAWLAPANRPRDQRSTRMTRHFLDKTFERLRKPAFPRHAFNCPESMGGKRGDDHPGAAAARVFPPQASGGTFPFVVDKAAKRTWAALSYPAAGVVDGGGKPVHTGVLLQPSHIAGDRYRVSVWVDPGLEPIDLDAKRDVYFDLDTDAKAVPHAATGLLTVVRTLKGTYYASPSFYAGIDATITEIKARLLRELGFDCDLVKKPFPDLQAGIGAQLDHVVKERTVFGDNASGHPLLLRTVVRTTGALDPDYAFHVWETTAEHVAAIEDWFKTKPLRFLTGAGGSIGKEVRGLTSGARGVLLMLPDAYADRGFQIALCLDDVAFAGEKIEELSGRSLQCDAAPAISTPVVVWDLELLTVDPATRGIKPSSRSVEVHDASDPTVGDKELTYDSGKFRPTRNLSDESSLALDEFLADIAVKHPAGQKLTIELIGKAGDTRGQERIAKIKTYLERRIVSRKALLDEFWVKTVRGLVKNGTTEQCLDRFDRDSVSPAWREIFNRALLDHAKAAAENAHWDTGGRAIFYHLRGRTVLDKKFTTGGIENLFCEEKLGIAGLTVPAVLATQRAEKRWLKSPIVVAVHEYGHALLLTHQLPRLFDTKVANGTTTAHLAHDACIMNYDADSSSFCAYCILRKRGWKLDAIATDALGHMTSATWAAAAMAQMKADEQADDTDVPAKVRLAMFLLDANDYLRDDVDRTDDAIALMEAARRAIPVDANDEKYIWLLRNLAVFYTKLKERAKLAKSGREVDFANKMKSATDSLSSASTLELDIDVTKENTAKGLGKWMYSVG